MIFLIGLGVVLVALFAWAIGYDLYWRRRGFRTEVRGWGRGMTHVRVPIKPDNDDELAQSTGDTTASADPDVR